MVPFVLGTGKAAGIGNHCSLVKEHSAPQGNHKELQVLPPLCLGLKKGGSACLKKQTRNKNKKGGFSVDIHEFKTPFDY